MGGYIFLTSLFFVITMAVFPPFEMYLNNLDDFWFGLNLFWWIPLLTGLVLLILLFGLGVLVNLIFKQKGSILYGTVLFAFGIACYAQGNFIGLKIGVLNGAPVLWDDYTKNILVNVFLWGCIVSSVLIFFYFMKDRAVRIIKYVSMILVAMQIVTLAILLFSSNERLSAEWTISDRGLYEVSAKKNVIVLILDMFDDEYFKELLEEEPGLQKDFTGFTQFTNSVGSASTTAYSINAILTGQYLLNNAPTLKEMLNNDYEKSDFIDILLANQYRLDSYIDLPPAYLPDKVLTNSYNIIKASASIADYRALFAKLYKLAFIKYAPDVFKPFFWLNGTEFQRLTAFTYHDDIRAYNYDNSLFFSSLTEMQIIVKTHPSRP
jgi:hypothetical protein